MASVTTLESQSKAQSQTEVKTPVRVERRDLSETMDKVRAELDKVRSNPDPDNVHDLRVAMRRCRSVATVFEEVDPDAAWPEMRKTAKKLFRALGGLRDAHVMEDWVKKLTPTNDPVRVQLHSSFETEEPELRSEVLRAAGKFDEKEWKRLQRRLRQRVQVLPVGGLAAECLAWERFEEIKQLHAQALRNKKAKALASVENWLEEVAVHGRKPFAGTSRGVEREFKKAAGFTWGYSRSGCVGRKRQDRKRSGRSGAKIVEADCAT